MFSQCIFSLLLRSFQDIPHDYSHVILLFFNGLLWALITWRNYRRSKHRERRRTKRLKRSRRSTRTPNDHAVADR